MIKNNREYVKRVASSNTIDTDTVAKQMKAAVMLNRLNNRLSELNRVDA